MKKLALGTLIFFQMASAQAGEIADNTLAFADLVRAQGEYTLHVAQAQLALAQADLAEAQAKHELVRVRELSLLVDRLELELKRVRSQEYKLQREIERIEEANFEVNLMKTGVTSPSIFSKLNIIIAKVIPAQVVRSAFSEAVDSFDADNFTSNSGRQEVEGFRGGNVGELIHFARTKNYQFAPFSPAHLAVLSALEQLEGFAVKRVEELNQRLTQIGQGHLEPIHENTPTSTPPTIPVVVTPVPVPRPTH